MSKSLSRKRRRKVSRQMLRKFEREVPTCWCGEPNPHHARLSRGCGGYRFMICLCGGDLCACHNHGEIECFGCQDCEGDDDSEPGWEGDYE